MSYTVRARYEALMQYLLTRVDERDWHGVADAANDLRVMEARYPELVRVPSE